jgi:hypothetical protein
MMDFASTHARAKGVAPITSREEGHTEAASASLPESLTSAHR